jgi:tetratricopeptide (TPR) repeat protein
MKRMLTLLASLLLSGGLIPAARTFPAATQTAAVKVWEEQIHIPTYLVGEPEPNPVFYFGRASQGAEGRVYPYPLYDVLTGRKADKAYRIVYLENEYIRIGVLPDIGGRLFEGVDKTNQYNFIYRQHVIKPALIGLIGAWISGGIEWNIPHHHRASTVLPVQYRVEANADGSKTVWVGELEVRHRMRWAVGYTLRPGRSYLEASLRISNRTPMDNSLLCFANVAVHANENYQVIFPPGTRYVTHHSKREFTTWPVATTRYGGYDFSPGVDVSWYKNHIAANSMFAWNYEDDFFAGYDHGRQAGIMSVADHNIVPGKKLWTWGNGPRGRMWDKILTDEDGPYIELMVGAYSDNQPDYSWLFPYETKTFEMYWYPFREIGGVKNANLEAAANLDVTPDGVAKVGFCTTRAQPQATVLLKAGDRVLLEEKIAISPDKPYGKEVRVPAGISEYDLRTSLSAGGKELIAYSPIRRETGRMPEPVTAPAAPRDIKTNEDLYLTGLRIEQFHNPTLDPDPYWEEALRRDPGDVRVNTALGIRLLKRARYAEAEQLLRRAIERLTAKYTAPKDAEPLYYLGVALGAQGRYDEAFNSFYKATWSAPWRAAAYYSIAEIATRRGDLVSALNFLDRSLEANALNIRACNLKAAVLRHLGRGREALQVLTSGTHKADPLDVRALAERWLASRSASAAKELTDTLTAHPATALETAAEYLNAGLWQDGSDVLLQMIQAAPDKARLSPLPYYYLASFAGRLGEQAKAAEYRRLAAAMPPDYVFPFQCEAIDILREAMQGNPRDARAPYYLGNLLFDWQPGEAVRLWEQSVSLDPSFPIAHRNLAIAYSRLPQVNSLPKAIASLEKATSGVQKYPLHFFELDQLYEAAAVSPEIRLALLEKNHDIVARRDDALSREVALKVVLGKYDDAIQLMTGRRFEVWEGGSLSVAEYWTDAHLLRGHMRRAARQYTEALADYQAAGKIPENLPSERSGSRQAELSYWTGIALDGMGDQEKAQQAWKAAAGTGTTTVRRPGGGGTSESSIQLYYRGLALQRLGQAGDAEEIFRDLVQTAIDALEKAPARIDFFASFGDQQSQRSRLALAHFVAGLGHLGLGQRDKARLEMTQALAISPDHLGARTALAELR